MAANKRIKIADLKANLSRHLRDVKAGQTITVVERDTPIALLAAYTQGIAGVGLETRSPVGDPRKLSATTSPLKKSLKNSAPKAPTSLEILTELRGDK